MLSSLRSHIGNATSSMVKASAVGVITAERINTATMTCRRNFLIIAAESTPSLPRIQQTIGISKTTASERDSVSIVSIYDSIVTVFSITPLIWYVPRKRQASGKTRK